jgi:hypothetical protein
MTTKSSLQKYASMTGSKHAVKAFVALAYGNWSDANTYQHVYM